MWTFLRRQQQRGAQLHGRANGSRSPQARQAGEAPSEAVAGREAQDHDYADLQTSPDGEPQRGIDYPASDPPNRAGDITPTAPEPHVEWDEVVQPERRKERQTEQGAPRGEPDDELPLPEGK